MERTAMVKHRIDWSTYSALALTIALCIPFFTLVLASCRVFPFSDEWHYLSPMTVSGAPKIDWLFAEHVDHRIPIQKLLHLIVLRATHFDFRSLVAVNFLAAAAASMLFIGAARELRGHGSVGDMFIPLCILSLGTGFSQWGFEFQFLSSILFSAAFLFFMSKRWTTASFLMLMLCAWCGLNGMLISTFVSMVAAAFVLVRRPPISASSAALLAATVVTNIVLWLEWVPSAASTGRASFRVIADFVFGMVNSPLLVFAFVGQGWKFGALAALIVAGTVAALIIALRKKSVETAMLFALVGAGWLLIASTAFGRAKETAWFPGLVIHYGGLALLLPVMAWIALSCAVGKRTSNAIGVALVVLFGMAYLSNYQWREGVISADRSPNMAARLAISTTDDPHSVAAKYITSYFYTDNRLVRSQIEGDIKILRLYSHYGPPK